MIERLEILDREQWLAMRQRNIGASEVSALLGANEYLSAFSLWATKSGLVTSTVEENSPMRRGRLLEPIALQILAEEHSKWIVEPNTIPGGVYYQDTDLRLGATPDAFITCPDRGRGIAQVKSVAPSVFREKWQPNGEVHEVPIGYAIQTICEAHLTGALWACVVALVVDHGIRIEVVDVPTHAPLIARVREEVARFWQMVEEGREPAPNYGLDAHLIERLFARPEEIEVDLTGDNELPEAVAEYQTLGKSIAEISELRKARRAEILHKMGNATSARIATGRITAKSIKRKAYAVPESSYRAIKFRETPA
jgi:predicted phage-related endonuclease